MIGRPRYIGDIFEIYLREIRQTSASTVILFLYVLFQRLALNTCGVLNQCVDVTGPGNRSQYLSINVIAVNTLIISISIEDNERHDQ